MTKKIRMILAGVVAFLGLTACNDNDAETITEQTLTDCFEFVNDITTNSQAAYSGVNYKIRLNYTQGKAEITINNLRTPDGTSYPTLSLANIPWSTTGKQIIVKGTDITPAGATVPVTFSSFNLTYSPRIIENNISAPGVGITFTINSRFAVTSANPNQIAFGTTTTTDAQGSSFVGQKTYYTFIFNSETRRVNITMNSTSFIPQMPAMDIELANVPYVIDGAMAKWEVESITPQIGGVPYGAFPITNLKGSFNFNTGLTMNFDCTPRNMGKYQVAVNCDITNSQPE